MDGMTLLRVERGIYYAALEMLTRSEVPSDLWPLVIDSAAGRIKDDAITALSAQDNKSTEEEADQDGEHTARN